MTTAAIVLAGGASRRFGRDKLAERLAGRPLLDLAIDAVRPVATTIVVVLAPDDDRQLPSAVLAVHDPIAHQGPLAGLAAGLHALDEDVERVVVLGGDMPSVAPAVLELLLERLDDRGVEAVWLRDDEDRERPLPLVLRRGPALAGAASLLDAGQRRLRALPQALGAEAIAASRWRTLDPHAGSLRDIDEPSDLEATGLEPGA